MATHGHGEDGGHGVGITAEARRHGDARRRRTARVPAAGRRTWGSATRDRKQPVNSMLLAIPNRGSPRPRFARRERSAVSVRLRVLRASVVITFRALRPLRNAISISASSAPPDTPTAQNPGAETCRAERSRCPNPSGLYRSEASARQARAGRPIGCWTALP